MGVGDIIGGLTSGAAQGIGIGDALRRRRQDSINSSAGPEAHDVGLDDQSQVQIMHYKRGGKVPRTGLAKVHKGERVLTAKQAKRYAKQSKRYKGK